MGIGLEDSVASVMPDGSKGRSDSEVRTGEGKAAVVPHGAGSSLDGIGNELGLGYGIADGNYGGVRAKPKAVMDSVSSHPAFFTQGIDFVASFVKPCLSPHGVA